MSEWHKKWDGRIKEAKENKEQAYSRMGHSYNTELCIVEADKALTAAERKIEYLSSFIDDRGLTDELWEAIKLAALQGGDDE